MLADVSRQCWLTEIWYYLTLLSVLYVAKYKAYLGSDRPLKPFNLINMVKSRCVFHCSRPTKQEDDCAPSDPFPRISNQRRIICLSALSVWQQPYWQLTPPSSSEGTVVSLSRRPLPRGCVLYIKNYKSQTPQRGRATFVIKAMQFLTCCLLLCSQIYVLRFSACLYSLMKDIVMENWIKYWI